MTSKMNNEDRPAGLAAPGGHERRLEPGGTTAAGQLQTTGRRYIVTYISTVIVMWIFGTYACVYFYPHVVYNALKRTIVQHGIEAGSVSGVSINTLYAMPALASPTTVKSRLLEGANNDTLYTVGWLDLDGEPEMLQVPDTAGRYYSIEFIDAGGNVFAYVGRRTTGTRAGHFLISGPKWQGSVPAGVTQIVSPKNSVLLLGRVLVNSESDLTEAYGIAKQIQVTALSRWLHSQ
jgi:hypothetical protein